MTKLATREAAEAMGYILPRLNPQSHEYFKRLVRALLLVAAAGIGPADGVTVTANPSIDALTLEEEVLGNPTTEVTGRRAAELIALQSHRLSTAEETALYEKGLKERKDLYASMTLSARGAQSIVFSQAFLEAVKEIKSEERKKL